MFKIYDGRSYFYQWDIDRKLIVEDASISEVHFCNQTDNDGLVCKTYIEDGLNLVNVPNILLQNDWRINVYAYDTNYTKFSERFDVIRRCKPEDYVYTETEVLNYNTLSDRITKIEEGGGITPTIGENGNWYLGATDTGKPSRGEKGDTGEKGEKGDTGAQGIQGEKGDKGEKGDTGATGKSGADGADGKSAYQIALDNGFVGSQSEWLASLKGDKGEKGDTGEQGIQGIQGEKGDTGVPGKDGKDGKDGITPTIGANGNWYIGSTDTGKPSRGDKGEQGLQGEQGIQGIQGAKGDKGDTGEKGAAGQSAYAAAQAGGYTDTEANFYADLAAMQGLASALAAI